MEEAWLQWKRQISRSRAFRAASGSEDEAVDVLVALVEKLIPPGGRALRSYPNWQERHPDKNFADWMRIVIANCVRDFLRSRHRPLDHAESLEEQLSPKRLLNEYTRSSVRLGLWVRPP